MRLIRLAALALALIPAVDAAAQARAQASSPFGGGGGSSSKGESRDIAVSIPLALYGEGVARVEFNLGTVASLTVEGNFQGRRDEFDEKETAETGESLVSDAK